MGVDVSSSDSEEEEQPSVALISSRNMEARAEHLKTRNYLSIYSFTTAVGTGMVVMLIVWLNKYRGGFSWSPLEPAKVFNWHPLLMGLGMIFLYGQSILLFRTGRNTPKKVLKILHAGCNFTAFVLSVIGLKAAFDSHDYQHIPNLYSMHSWIGLITAIIFAGQFLTGFVTFLFPGLASTLRQLLLPVHVATGVATFILALTACVTGLTEKAIWTLGNNYSHLPSEATLVNFICVFAIFYGVLCAYLVNEPNYKRANLLQDEVALAQN